MTIRVLLILSLLLFSSSFLGFRHCVDLIGYVMKYNVHEKGEATLIIMCSSLVLVEASREVLNP